MRVLLPFLCLYILGCPVSALAQKDSLRVARDNFYIYPRTFAVRLIYQERSLPFSLSPLIGQQNAVYEPNSTRTIGVGGSLFGVSFTLAFPLPQNFQRDADRYGSTKQKDLRIHAFQQRWGLQIDRQDYIGYHLYNISELDADWKGGDVFPYRSDLRTRRLGVGISYLLKPEFFSYSAALNNKQRQRLGGGTFFFQVYGGRLWIGGDSLLLPRPYFRGISAAERVEEIKVYQASLMAGYAHTFVMGRFYLMTSLALGPELQKRNLAGESQLRSEQWATEGRLQLQAAFGYDDDKYFWNIAYNSQRQQYEVDGLGVSVNATGVRLLVGRRFQEVGFMKKIRQTGLYQRIRGDE